MFCSYAPARGPSACSQETHHHHRRHHHQTKSSCAWILVAGSLSSHLLDVDVEIWLVEASILRRMRRR